MLEEEGENPFPIAQSIKADDGLLVAVAAFRCKFPGGEEREEERGVRGMWSVMEVQDRKDRTSLALLHYALEKCNQNK